ncbi:HNH endonuclease [Paenibacillus validus]|uniref:HNH endonuclease n=1 Tax=Paenibacillus validus TaxID=44253 RepID=UPI003D2E034A
MSKRTSSRGEHVDQELNQEPTEPYTDAELPSHKRCAHCQEMKPLTDFLRRTGRRSGKSSRRGACRACRMERKPQSVETPGQEARARKRPRSRKRAAARPAAEEALVLTPKRRISRPLPIPPPRPKGPDVSVLRVNREGFVWMRGRTDKGRRWQQETDLETAVTLVREFAAVVVNRHTIRRVYTNRMFRLYILTRDHYTCHFCGEYGDTIDHLLPRAKGGHTTPVNCVCACHICNQEKADRSLDEFIVSED